MLVLGLVEAGLIDQTLFKPPELTSGVVGAATWVPALGISVSDLLSFVVGHAGWSIGVPIAMVEAPVPARRTTPWLGRAGVAVTGAPARCSTARRHARGRSSPRLGRDPPPRPGRRRPAPDGGPHHRPRYRRSSMSRTHA